MKASIIFVIDNFLFEFYYTWLEEEFRLFCIAGHHFTYHFVFDEVFYENWELKLIKAWYAGLKKQEKF